MPFRLVASRPLLAVAALAVAVGCLAPVTGAGALGSARLERTRIAVAPGSFVEVRVDWSGQPARTLMFVSVCNLPSSTPGFNAGSNCSPLTGVTPNGTPDGSGSALVPVFRGPDPGGDLPWGCFAPGDAAPPGVQRFETCYVRVTNTVILNDLDAVDLPFTLTGEGAPPSAGALGAPGASAAPAPAAPTAVSAAVADAPAEARLAFAG